MKRTIKRLALALAAVLLCFLMAGCSETGSIDWNTDLEGNEVASTSWKKNSDGGYIITRKYTVNDAAVNANGRALVSQEVTTGAGDLVTQVSRLYVVSKEAMENTLTNSLSLLTDTNTECYVIVTFHYGFPSRDGMDSAEIVYRNADRATVTIQYDGSLAVTDGEPDNTIIHGALSAIVTYAVNDSSFQSAMKELSRNAYDYADDLCIETQIDRGAF